ncbi:TonB-dependent receptor [Thalassotalea agarivorans]|uniref:Iron complex outermembrane recepter protein n=1 Tax=Thalassotalea agarivorans TaxID=349064 RepID=A0A1I0DDH3_THASX|nr:TonB-dependent receptor [Thalassotalea agarivorans]SET30061.1 iron complex outermembrane recepter protein [Thalassotalea agarivorans]
MDLFKRKALSIGVQSALVASAFALPQAIAADEASAEDNGKLEVIEVTARKRVENVQDVPVSVSALQGENLEAYGSAAQDIRFLNAKIPSLSVESSFGRTFPRFYMRGLGNSDFDLNASQPVSLVMDEVVQENPILKGFPVFDVERVEALRGPQGTLFGRNTPAGLVKFDSVKPTQELDGYASLGYGSYGTIDFDGAVGTGITDNLSFRASMLYQTRDDYIDNVAPGFEQENVLGGYDETAARLQFLYEDGGFSALVNFHTRNLDGKPIVFRANVIDAGTNNIADYYDEDTVMHDAASRAIQNVDTQGGSLKLEYDAGELVYTSITGFESAEIYSQADVDGGYGASFLPPELMGPGLILFPAESADAIPDHSQFTQEFRISSAYAGKFNFQTGLFFFSEDLTIDSYSFDTLAAGAQNGFATQNQKTTAWALFGSADYQLSEKLKLTAGLRYSNDEKDFVAERLQGPFGSGTAMGTANPSDSHVSWDLSAVYSLNDEMNLFARIANGFRAPSIQGRILFGDVVTVADSETINSIETGIKSDILDGRGRFNATVYYYQMDNQQLTAVGGDANFNQLINADQTTGYGLEIDSEFVVAENFFVTANMSYNSTEISDSDLAVAVCAQCTVTDPLNGNGLAILDGNSLPHSPELIANLTARYSYEIGAGQLFVYTDWSYRSEIDFFLYKSVEFEGKPLLEGGLRGGYQWETDSNEWEVALFARNITDEQVVIGGVDFNNLTGMINEGRFVGAEVKVSFF